MTLKSRATAGAVAKGYTNGVYTGQSIMPGITESMEGFSHDLSALGQRDCGGPWLLTRDNWQYSFAKCTGGSFKGSDFVPSGGTSTSHQGAPSDSSLNTQGATAIARTIPTAPTFNSLVALSELMRDGVPSVPGTQAWKEGTIRAQTAGSEYLNVEFGWIPLVNDMRNFAKVVKSHSEILDELQRGSGKFTRVGYGFPGSTSSGFSSGSINCYKGGNTGVTVTTSYNYSWYKQARTWFKGAFKYHLPASTTQAGKMALYASYADKLLGIKPTPAAIWNAAPWTWALDWFGNTGDVLTNISELGQDGLALAYGYIMSFGQTKELWSCASKSGTIPITASSKTRTREFKKRLPANPYGFGVTDAMLSLNQYSVAVALGLTHGRGGSKG
jgi:hypothetical protein